MSAGLTCKRCGQRIVEYRGSWFSAGDESRCEWGKPEYHAPDPAALLRSRVEATARSVPREVAERVVAEVYEAAARASRPRS
jgi:hypothetical protein